MGGQVFVVPEEYYGVAGLAKGVSAGVDNYTKGKEHKDDKEYEGLVRTVSLAQAAHASPETIAKIVSDHPYTKKHGLNEVQAQLSGEEMGDREYAEALKTPELQRTPRQQQIVNKKQLGTLNPNAEVKSADLGVEKQTQDLEVGKQNLAMGKQQLTSNALSIVNQVHKDFGQEAAIGVKKAFNDLLGNMPDNVQLTMDDIDAQITKSLANDPKALNGYKNLKTVGDVRGVAGATRTANLKDEATQSGINVDTAQINKMRADSAAELAGAKAAGMKAQMDIFQSSMNNLVNYGASPTAIQKYVADPTSMSESDKANIQHALVAFAEKGAASGNHAGQNLTTLSMAIKRGTVADPTGQLMAKATAEFASTLGDGQQYQAVKKEHHGIFGTKESWGVEPITKPIEAGPVDQAMELEHQIREEIGKILLDHDPESVKRDIDALEGPNKVLYTNIFNELTQGKKYAGPDTPNVAAPSATKPKAYEHHEVTPEEVKANRDKPVAKTTSSPAFEQKSIRVNEKKIADLRAKIEKDSKLAAKAKGAQAGVLNNYVTNSKKAITELEAKIADSRERLKNAGK